MKVTFNYGFRTYSGKLDNMVYGSYRHGNLCLGRKFVYPVLTANNHEKGSIIKNLATVFHAASVGYIADLKTYCQRNGKENVAPDALIPSAFSMFLKLMWAWYESDPTHVDLEVVQISDIIALDADVRTLARAVNAGFLPYISTSADLTNDIQ